MDCMSMFWLMLSLDGFKREGGIPDDHAVLRTLLSLRTALVKARRGILPPRL